MTSGYTFVDHTADIAVDIATSSLEELFTLSASAWKEVVCELVDLPESGSMKIELTSFSIETLLVTFISELNFLFQKKYCLMTNIEEIKISEMDDEFYLAANIIGSTFNLSDIKLKAEVKAVTYHQMEIEKLNGQFKTRIIFDI
ncbi:MAG: archease [Ignavibacteriales bacterium]|nr:MAG: archease [Ignavibacteriales bacterium]